MPAAPDRAVVPAAPPPTASRAEMRALARLAWPVVLAELGWMAMVLVDTMLAGHVSAETLGGVSVGSHVSFTITVVGMGVLLGLDPVVAHAHGGGRAGEAHRALVQGLWLAAVLSAVLTPAILLAGPRLAVLGVSGAVRDHAAAYLAAIAWGTPPLLGFVALRRYVQAVSLVRPVTAAVLTANVVHLAAAWVLVFGRLGAPALGAAGAAWATVASRCWMLAWLAAAALAYARRDDAALLGASARPDPAMLGRLLRLGAPAAAQLVLEIAVFAAATLLAARFEASALAAHQVALGAAATAFMVPLGISSAAAVRVAQALGRDDPRGAVRAGTTALLAGAGVMATSASLFLLAPRAVLRAFTDDPAVVEAGVPLLVAAAAFQLFDGLQVVATGVLRGTGDTHTPMLAGVAGHWLLGLPLGWWLGLGRGYGVVGLWVGLCAGLIAVAAVLVGTWVVRARAMSALRPAAA